MANALQSVNDYLSGGAAGAASSDAQGAINTLAANVPPQLANLIPQLQQEVVAGTMTPAQAQASLQQASAANGIQSDPTTSAAQLQALSQLQNISQSGGLTSADKAQLSQLEGQVGQQNAARQGAVMQQAQEQGIGGSGADLAARLSGAQSANVAAADQSNNVAEDAQNRALNALSQSGQLATTMNQNDFNNALAKAQSQNNINQFNAQNQTQASEYNANNQQNANLTNLANAQNVANTNTGIQNTQAMLPLQTQQAQAGLNNTYAENLGNSQLGAANTNTKLAQQNTTQSGADIAAIPGVINGATNLAGSIGSGISNLFSSPSSSSSSASSLWSPSDSDLDAMGWSSDPNGKCDVKDLTDDDIDDLLSKLTGKTYKYKKGSMGDDGGKIHMGIMTTDLAKTPLKGNVAHTDKGDVIMNDDDMNGAILAALSHIHQKMKDLT